MRINVFNRFIILIKCIEIGKLDIHNPDMADNRQYGEAS